MVSVDVHELKTRLSKYLRMARRGEEILVTDRGEPVAELRQFSGVSHTAAYPELELRARGQGATEASLFPTALEEAARG